MILDVLIHDGSRWRKVFGRRGGFLFLFWLCLTKSMVLIWAGCWVLMTMGG